MVAKRPTKAGRAAYKRSRVEGAAPSTDRRTGDATPAAGRVDLASLRRLITAGAVDTVAVVFPDMFGRLMGKRMTGRFFLDSVASHGMHACDYLLACDVEMDPVPGYTFTSWESGYGDFLARPDFSTARVIPWLPKTAIVLCDLVTDPGEAPVTVAPRTILRRQVDRAAAAGFTVKAASELEFYAFRDSFEAARRKHYHDLETSGWYVEDYHILQGTKEEGLIRAIRNGMEAANIPIESSKGEWGPGQHEINLEYCDVFEMADRHVLYKHGVKEIAALQGAAVTFMAKWDERFAGSSFHLHTSLWDRAGRRSCFHEPSRPDGMSDTMRHWLGGLLAHAREFTLLYAPFVNSYKRYQAASFAPTRLVWSHDNRTAGFRLVGSGSSLRIENRIPGADANPYLVYAAVIASGLDGIERGIEPPERFAGNAYDLARVPTVPLGLVEAIHEMEGSELARRALGDDVVEHYLHAARTEHRKFAEVVTCWERLRHFERT